MNRLKPIEYKAIYFLTGLLAGLLLLILVYFLIYSISERLLIADFLLWLHREFPLIYIIDLLPVPGAFIGYRIALSKIRFLQQLGQRSKDEANRAEYIRKAIHDLTIGNLNTSISEELIGAEMAERLKSMQHRLKENLTSQKTTRQADQQRNWTSQGLAEFGDILRSNSSDIEQLGYAVISGLVRYLDINQGGFFTYVENGDNRYFEMIACHAYDRKKFPDKRINWGEGLIGAVAIEQKSYYTNKIPEGYLSITSGLGRANPRHLLIVPLVLNEEVFGILELASFVEIEDYKIQFVERVAENTATTLNIMQSNFRTKQLLKETQEQAAKLLLQEEKVRQNIEELKLTQLEANRQSEQFISFTNTVNHTLIRAEYSVEGTLLYANTRFLKKFGYSGNMEVDGKHIYTFIHTQDRDWFAKVWERLSSGGEHYEGYMRHVTKLGLELWTMATYTCVRKEDGTIEKVLFLSIDSSEQKANSLNFEGQIRAINKLSPKAEFSPDGRLVHYNDLFLKTLKLNGKDAENKNVFDFFAHSDQERFNEIWEQVLAGNAFQGQLRMMGRYEEDVWLRATFSTIEDVYGEVDKVIFLGYEITKEKELEFFMHERNEKLKEKEDELRMQSLDLKKRIDELNGHLESEKQRSQLENKKYTGIIDHHPLPLLSINNQGFVVLINRSAEKLFKKSRKAVLNRKIDQLLSSYQSHPALQAYVETGRKKIILNEEQVLLTLADQRQIEVKLSLFESESGNELFYTLMVGKGNAVH